jgi:hypothetical protein
MRTDPARIASTLGDDRPRSVAQKGHLSCPAARPCRGRLARTRAAHRAASDPCGIVLHHRRTRTASRPARFRRRLAGPSRRYPPKRGAVDVRGPLACLPAPRSTTSCLASRALSPCTAGAPPPVRRRPPRKQLHRARRAVHAPTSARTPLGNHRSPNNGDFKAKATRRASTANLDDLRYYVYVQLRREVTWLAQWTSRPHCSRGSAR